MTNKKPKSVPADTDDLKLAVIEHLTGERLQRRSAVDDVFRGAVPIAAVLFSVTILGLWIPHAL